MNKLVLLVGFLGWIFPAVAQDSLLLRMADRNSPLLTRFVNPENFSAASIALLGSISHIELVSVFNNERWRSNDIVPDGDKHNYGRLQASGIVSGSGNYSFGIASYEKGAVSDRNGRNALDRDRTGPYTLVDSVGGTLHYETYSIGGAFAFPVGKFIVGVGMDYVAQNGYRQHDPRFKTIISDFKFKTGVMRTVGKYDAGIGLEAGRYSQNVSIRNFQADRKDYIYYHYGLGYYGKMFSETTDNSSMDYAGITLEGNWFWLPKEHDDGYFFVGQYNYQSTEANYGKIHPGVYRLTQIDANGGYWLGSRQIRHKLGAFVEDDHGVGTEYVYEKVVVNEQTHLTDYRLLTHSAKYRFHHTSLGMEYLMITGFLSSSTLSVNGRLFFVRHKESYANTASLSSDTWNGELNIHWQKIFQQSWLSADFGLACQNEIDSSFDGIQQNIISRYDIEPLFVFQKQQQTSFFAGVLFVQKLSTGGALKGGVKGELASGSVVDQSMVNVTLGYIF